MKKGIILLSTILMTLNIWAQEMYVFNETQRPQLTQAGAEHLASLAFHCIQTEYPNKLGHVILDATQGVDRQDVNIFHLAEKNKNAVVVVVNKWDLVKKESNTHLSFEKTVKERLAPFNDVPVIFTSITEKQRIVKLLDVVSEIYDKKRQHISTSKLNEFFLPIIENQPHPEVSRGRRVKIKYVMQLKNTVIPQFVFFCNLPTICEKITFSVIYKLL